MTNSINQEQLKSFLFYELNDIERQAIEEQFFENEDLFDDLMELENELVDGYIHKKLSATDTKRFEKSLELSAERREKVANAQALNTFITEENLANAATVYDVKTVEDTPTFWEKIAAFFTFQMPVMQYAAALLVLALVGGITYLVYDNIQKSNQIANDKKRQEEQERIRQKEEELKRLEEQRQLNEQRQKDLENQPSPETNINTENPINQTDKTEELNKLKEENQKIEEKQNKLKDETNKLKNDKSIAPVQKKELPQPPKPTIATITLFPMAGPKGPNGGSGLPEVKNAKTIVATLDIPEEVKSESFEVKLNGGTIQSNVKNTGKTITVRINTKNLKPNVEHSITIIGNDGRRRDYGFVLKN